MEDHKRHFRRLEFLSKLAEDLPGSGNLQHGCGCRVASAIFIRNDLISIGWNQQKSSPFQAKYGKNPKAIFLHSEIHAIKRALRDFSIEEFTKKKKTLYICRVKKCSVTKKFIWGLSKPCKGCISAIYEFNFQRVIFSLNEDICGEKMFDIWEI